MEYSSQLKMEIASRSTQSKLFAYADIIVDEQTGILLRPLSLLSTDLGLRMLVNTTTSLSLQYTVLWTILYCQEANRY